MADDLYCSACLTRIDETGACECRRTDESLEERLSWDTEVLTAEEAERERALRG